MSDAQRFSYNAYGPWLRRRYEGTRVYKVIVSAGFTCPNRDGSKGYGGCTYCNVESFTPELPRSIDEIREQVLASMARARKRFGAEKFVVYFQPNSNTYAPVERLKALYDEALSAAPECTVGLSVGTRPDCLDEEKIALLESYCDRYDVDLELGMESPHEVTLEKINRGCTHADLVGVLNRLENTPMNLCLHTIFGFPWESREMLMEHIEVLNRFPQVQFAKFHNLHIVKGSILGARYRKQPFGTLSLEDYTDLLCEAVPRLRPDVVIQRLFGVADPELLIAPNWDMPKAAVQTYIEREFAKRGVVQGSEWAA